MIRFVSIKLILLFAFLFFITGDSFTQITVSNDFEGANARVININNLSNSVKIESLLRPGDIHNVVFYCRISGFNTSQPFKIQVKYSEQYYLPVLAAYSYDKQNWSRITGTIVGDSKEFIKVYSQNTIYFSVGYPYTYTDMLNHISSISGSPFLQVSDIAESSGGRNVKLLRITEHDVSDSGKYLVWVLGRQHAMESHSNYVVSGFIDFCLSDDPAADVLRKQAIVYVVPVMDVDKAATGGTGKDQLPVDFNRDWDSPSYWSAVIAVKKKIAETAAENKIKIFIDSHNPFPGSPGNSERLFFYSLYNSGPKSVNLDKLRALFQTASGYPIDRQPSYATAGQTSSRYVDSMYNEIDLSLSLETGWVNRTDNVEWTIPRYIDNGKYLGKSISNYLNSTIGISGDEEMLFSNVYFYPNPFNSTATIKFSLTENSYVKIIVYDILGREIRELLNSYRIAGQHSLNFNSNDLTSGIYFYRIAYISDKNEISKTGKLFLIK